MGTDYADLDIGGSGSAAPGGAEVICALRCFCGGNGDPNCLERWLRGLVWVRESGLIWWDIVILSDGLGEESRGIAQRAAEQYADVLVETVDEIKDWMDE